MNSAPGAKLTTPSMPNTIVSPSAVITRTAPRAIPERSCMMISDRSIARTSGRVAQLTATAQHVVGASVVGENGEQIVVVGHGGLLFGLQDQPWLHRLVVAFAVVLRTLGQVVLQLLQGIDHLVGISAPRGLHGRQQRPDAGITVGAVVGRDGAAIGCLEGGVESGGGLALRL